MRKRTRAQRDRMSAAQQERYRKARLAKVNGTTVPVGEIVRAVNLTRQLVELVGADGAKLLIDSVE